MERDFEEHFKKKFPHECVGCQFLTRTKEEIELNLIQTKVWLTVEEAAKYAGLSRRNLDRYRIEGTSFTNKTLPFSKLGAVIRIKRTDIDKYFMMHRVESDLF
ncbi:helix-turn-helix domain-containing protein [uncultured Draconibacterium sp.]|uniref:helix-turn-helix domain-containing protein n=1 Tax=uncultured Draconibacterium sp. TaxID=1573823 RepID=UPI0025CC1DA7|nr:helix-turn-helix domain-containing protein [uncultured Draconibacterium sp.]